MRQSFSIKRLKMKAHHQFGVTSDGYDFGTHSKDLVVALYNYLLIYFTVKWWAHVVGSHWTVRYG